MNRIAMRVSLSLTFGLLVLGLLLPAPWFYKGSFAAVGALLFFLLVKRP